jgi:hypothetical protein
MRRQLVSSLLAFLVVLTACVAISTPTAHAAVPAEPAARPYLAYDWTAAKADANGGRSYVIKHLLDGTWEPTDAKTGKVLPKRVAYPTIGPYWATLRWLNAGPGATSPARPGHPYACVMGDGNLDSAHPIKTVTTKWDIDDFVVRHNDHLVVNETRCVFLSNYYRADYEEGARTDTCNHLYVHATNNIVDRMIGYWDTNAFDGECFDLAEENVWRTSHTFGAMFGLQFHHGSGAPSVMAGVLDYIWPQNYDRRTLAWYN